MAVVNDMDQAFLSSIMPEEGHIAVFPSQKSKGVWVDFTDPDWRARFLQANTANNVYYSPASYQGKQRREAEVQASHVIFLDIDAGPEKQAKHGKDSVYDDANEALTDLFGWLAEQDLPEPSWVVSSGYGLHVYWEVDEAMDLIMWKGLEAGLVRKATDDELLVDTAVMSMNELLRLPGSVHQSTGNVVTVLADKSSRVRYSYLDLCRAFPPVEVAVASAPGELGPRPEHLANAPMADSWKPVYSRGPRYYRRLLDKSTQGEGEGCAFLAKAYNEAASLPEPLWRAELSIVVNCDDGAEFIHEVSHKHPGYSREETEEKAARVFDMPYSCESIEMACPGICDGCPHRGHITNPLQLAEDKLEQAVVTPESHREKVLQRRHKSMVKDLTGDMQHVAEMIANIETLPAVMPEQYGLTEVGQLIRLAGEGNDAQVVYPRPFYLVERLRSDQAGDMLLLNYESPSDGTREFEIEQTMLASPDNTLKALSRVGILAMTKGQENQLLMFLKHSAQTIQERRAREMRSNFGWQDHTSSFVHGRHEFTCEGDINLTSVQGGDAFVDAMQPKQSADPREWARLAKLFNKPGYEPALQGSGQWP